MDEDLEVETPNTKLWDRDEARPLGPERPSVSERLLVEPVEDADDEPVVLDVSVDELDVADNELDVAIDDERPIEPPVFGPVLMVETPVSPVVRERRGRTVVVGIAALLVGAGIAGGAVRYVDARETNQLRSDTRAAQSRSAAQLDDARADVKAADAKAAVAQRDLDAANKKAADLQQQLAAANAATADAKAELAETQRKFFEYAAKYNDDTAALAQLAPPGSGAAPSNPSAPR